MHNQKLPKVKTVSERLDKDYSKRFSENPSIKIDSNLKKLSPKLSKKLNEKLEDHLALFEESLKVIITTHELCKQYHTNKKQGTSYVVLSAKMVTLLLGIRQMIYSGFPDCIKNLNRPLIETIEVFYACLIDDKLSNSFSRTDEMYDNDKFYWENFSKGKLEKHCAKLFKELEIPEESIAYMKVRKSGLKSFLSESIHSSFNASFSSYITMGLDLEFEDNIYGKITIAYPRLLISLIEEIFIFNNTFYLAIEKKISKELEEIMAQDSSPLYQFYYEKYNILCDLYFEKLSKESQSYNDVIGKIKTAFENYNDA